MNRPQQPQQQQNQQQNRPRPPPQNNNQQMQAQQNIPNPGFYYPYYPMVMPHSIPNQASSQNSNLQLHNALNSMMNRNSFLGFVDPLIIVAIIAIPVIAMLGFSSVIMPFIPVIIYVLNIFFPIGTSAGRKKRSIALDRFCLNIANENNFKHLVGSDKKDHLLYANKLNELEIYLKRFHRSICNFHF